MSGEGIRQPTSGPAGPTPELATTQPQLDDDARLTEAPAGRQPRSDTVDRAERLVSELDRQLRTGEPDPNLLNALGWTPEQATRFVREFRQVKDRAPRTHRSPDGPQQVKQTATRQPGEDRLQTGKGRNADIRSGAVIDRREADQIRRLLEIRRQQVGKDYRDLLEAYYKTVAGMRPGPATTQPAK